MNDALKTYIKQYVVLESGMQELVLKKCSALCAQCTAVCCDVVMCVEAIKSPFLKLVHQQEDQFNEQLGFLSPTGCQLKQGRPSVCYEYYCDNHFYYQPDDLHAEVLKIIGALLYHATRNAKRDLPLDEIMQEEALDSLDFQQLEKQMQESLQALEIIRDFYRTGTMADEPYKTLKLIQIPEEFKTPAESSAH